MVHNNLKTKLIHLILFIGHLLLKICELDQLMLTGVLFLCIFVVFVVLENHQPKISRNFGAALLAALASFGSMGNNSGNQQGMNNGGNNSGGPSTRSASCLYLPLSVPPWWP